VNTWFPIEHSTDRLAPSSRAALDVAPDALLSLRLRARFNETLLTFRQLMLAFAVLVIIFALFLGKALYLQTFEGDAYRAVAEQNRTRTLVLPATRGVMYDSQGRQLVQNAPAFTLVITPSELPSERSERLSVLEEAARLADLSPTDLDLAIANDSGKEGDAIPVDLPLSYESALKLYLAEERLPGISAELFTVRSYEEGPLSALSHVLGYTGFISPEEYEAKRASGYQRTDKLGKQGLEASYETILRGSPGTRTVEVNALGRSETLIRKEEPVAGYNLRLTLDGELSLFIEERLAASLSVIGKRRGTVIVLNPRDGGVRALVSTPGYDNNAFAEGISPNVYRALLEDEDRPMFPRAVMGEFPPGSTFKPTVAAIALEDGLISEKTSFLSTGGVAVASWFFPDWKAGGHGTTNVVKAIAESVNTFFYIIGGGLGDFRGLGIERITEQAKLFGFGEPTGIDLPEEANGFLPSKAWKEEVKGERWYIGDTYHAAIGQGDILVTPLQMAVATSVLANGGVLFEPHLLASTERNGVEIQFEPVVRSGEVMSRETISVVRRGMRQAVTEGSARSLALLPKPVAGKTGTAQAGGDRENHAWFTSFGPYENPELVVTVLIEEGGEGSAVAAPLARDIYAWWFANR